MNKEVEMTEIEIVVYSDEETEKRNIQLEYGCDELFWSHEPCIYCSNCGTIFWYDYEAHKDVGLWERQGYESECPLCDGSLYHIMLVQILENFRKVSEENNDG